MPDMNLQNFLMEHLGFMLKRRTDAESECMEDRRDGRIGATEYAEGNGTWKRGGDAEHIM